MYIGGVDPGELMKLTASAPGFIGAMQQFILNGQESGVTVRNPSEPSSDKIVITMVIVGFISNNLFYPSSLSGVL